MQVPQGGAGIHDGRTWHGSWALSKSPETLFFSFFLRGFRTPGFLALGFEALGFRAGSYNIFILLGQKRGNIHRLDVYRAWVGGAGDGTLWESSLQCLGHIFLRSAQGGGCTSFDW